MKWKKKIQILIVFIPVLFLFFQGYKHRWNSEDAFISFRVVENILAGHGPVYNIDERVEAYTHPLWIGVLSLSTMITKSIELSAVWLGLIFSCIGLLSGTMGGININKKEEIENSVFIPLGAFIIASLPPFWDFVTSGLETGLTFLWLGVSFFLLTNFLKEPKKPNFALLWFSLGTLIRPDLGIFWIGFLIVVISILSKVHKEKISFSSILKFFALSFILPLFYQLFRMGYFASAFPNPAFAKEAFRLNIKQGLLYLWDFISPYALYIPIILCFFTIFITFKNLKFSRKEAIVYIPFFTLGIFHITYVVLIGGDFMHGRFLLPGFFSMFISVPLLPISKTPFSTFSAGSVITWCIICSTILRFPYTEGKFGITNEREFYMNFAGKNNPVRIIDYRKCGFYEVGIKARKSVKKAILKKENPYLYHENIGIAGFVAGSKVHVFDRLGLADPIASRLDIERRGRPGHEKDMPLEWVLARVDPEREDIKVKYARRAMECGDLKEYLDAIQGELNLKKFLKNIKVAIKTIRMRIPVEPYQACKNSARIKKQDTRIRNRRCKERRV